MKKFQKLTALLLSFLLLACVMAGCGKTDDSDFPVNTAPGDSPSNREDEVNQQAHETDQDTSGTRYDLRHPKLWRRRY